MSDNIFILVTFLIAWAILVFPLNLAAVAMGAERTGLIMCSLALFGASFLHGVGLSFGFGGTIAAFVLSAVAFKFILGAGWFRGAGIAVLYVVLYSLTFTGLSWLAETDLSVLDLPDLNFP